MKRSAPLLDLPAARAVRWLALNRLQDARAARERLSGGEDAEALHDFRVAVRRLRSLLRDYRGVVKRVRRKERRRLAELARGTGAARDAEVQLAWLAERRPRARGAERVGIAWWESRLLPRAAAARLEMAEAVARFPAARRRLERRLSRYRVRVRPDDPSEGPALRALLAERLAGTTEELAAALAEVAGEDRQAEAHRARIAVKRVRYLLEPVAAEVPGAPRAIRELKGLQDALGTMHDLHVLREEVGAEAAAAEAGPPPGAEALIGRLGRGRRAAFTLLQRDWLGGRADALLGGLRKTAATLAPGSDLEVERKYLLRRLPRLAGLPATAQEIDQGYLPGERLVERVRRVKDEAGARYYRTVKIGTGIARIELEEECPEPVFRALWRLTRGRRVRKVRYRIPVGERVWEVDRFRDRRLVLAEVELPDEDAPVEVPGWLARVLDREVTGEAAYVNLNLAR